MTSYDTSLLIASTATSVVSAHLTSNGLTVVGATSGTFPVCSQTPNTSQSAQLFPLSTLTGPIMVRISGSVSHHRSVNVSYAGSVSVVSLVSKLSTDAWPATFGSVYAYWTAGETMSASNESGSPPLTLYSSTIADGNVRADNVLSVSTETTLIDQVYAFDDLNPSFATTFGLQVNLIRVTTGGTPSNENSDSLDVHLKVIFNHLSSDFNSRLVNLTTNPIHIVESSPLHTIVDSGSVSLSSVPHVVVDNSSLSVTTQTPIHTILDSGDLTGPTHVIVDSGSVDTTSVGSSHVIIDQLPIPVTVRY